MSAVLHQVNSFFDTYAHALETYDTKGMAYLYHVPCTLLSDESEMNFNDLSKLEGFFNQGSIFYKQFGIAHARPDIWLKREWTSRIINTKVHWQFFDKDNQPLYDCDYLYVLKPDKNGQLKIILSVSVNEKEKMEAWMQKRKKK